MQGSGLLGGVLGCKQAPPSGLRRTSDAAGCRYAPLFPGNLALKGYKGGGAAGTAVGAAACKHQLGQRGDSAAEVGTVAAE